MFETERERMVTAIPAVESFFSQEGAEWVGKEIAEAPEYRDQVQERKHLIEAFEKIASSLPRPDVEVEQAIHEGVVSEEQIADLFESLSAMLEKSEDYRRIVLYLPFEILPGADWRPNSPALKNALTKFKAAYLFAWRGLLGVHDVRANFVDGDVLETESRTGDLPRVVKAAHLLPKLIEKGWISSEEAKRLSNGSDDELLKESIEEGLAATENNPDYGQTAQPKRLDPTSLRDRIDAASREATEAMPSGITEKRKAWLTAEGKRRAVEAAGDDIKEEIMTGGFGLADELVKTGEVDLQIAAINGVRKASESDPEIYPRFSQLLLDLWQRKDPVLIPELSKTFCRLNGLKIVPDSQLHELRMAIPRLAGPFSENLKGMSAEVEQIKSALIKLEQDPEIAEYVFPAALMFGSKLKGYGNPNADTDVAVFTRPGADPREGRVREALKKVTEMFPGDVVPFWLEQLGENYQVRDSDELGSHVGDKYWTHILFGGAWEGDPSTVVELQKKLLLPYLYRGNDEKIHGLGTRRLFLEELERDSIQYRLMHKGYEKFFPRFGGISGKGASKVDGQSAFWDSGFRFTATRLFLNRVFLPKLSR